MGKKGRWRDMQAQEGGHGPRRGVKNFGFRKTLTYLLESQRRAILTRTTEDFSEEEKRAMAERLQHLHDRLGLIRPPEKEGEKEEGE